MQEKSEQENYEKVKPYKAGSRKKPPFELKLWVLLKPEYRFSKNKSITLKNGFYNERGRNRIIRKFKHLIQSIYDERSWQWRIYDEKGLIIDMKTNYEKEKATN